VTNLDPIKKRIKLFHGFKKNGTAEDENGVEVSHLLDSYSSTFGKIVILNKSFVFMIIFHFLINLKEF